MPRELHLASIVVHARPDRVDDVSQTIVGMGLERHLASPEGKLVFTHESESARDLGDTLTQLQLLDGVLAATMVYHHCEPVAEDAPSDEPDRETTP
ncbi:chaperone NapD [Histidinibacterium aquaticum]|uniref:Chaperone NapD n=1 Tax=Histidinibacterium aquaticum TaxID=2613962 RepID=A0A5J5GL70_9RHOB|nr:chaperone NapD [Histidinibacterium aquaticum]KAA9009021.1 glutamate synthase [Histidinibacterium aquaticum]